jgi:small nuclear ribonucleoprotein E
VDALLLAVTRRYPWYVSRLRGTTPNPAPHASALQQKTRTVLSSARYFSHTISTMASRKVKKVMTQPINLIFRFLQNKSRVQIWLYEQPDARMEGVVIGFDEYMNLTLDDAEEIDVKRGKRKRLGRILLKGDNITLMMNAPAA